MITQNRFIFAAIGDESASCNDGGSGGGGGGSSSGGCNENMIPTFKVVQAKRKVRTWEACRTLCDNNAECEYFRWKVKLFCSVKKNSYNKHL